MRSGQAHAAFADQCCVAYDIETIASPVSEDGSFPPWPRHQPVAAAFLTATRDLGNYSFRLDTLLCRPGREAEFYAKVEGCLPLYASGIGFNSRAFDNRVLGFQASIHCPDMNLPGLARQVHSSRFSGVHRDLADVYSGYSGARPVALAELCRPLCIPIKTDISGADVGQLWEAGEHQRIMHYVQEDVFATFVLHLHSLALERSNERLLTLPLAELAEWIEREPGIEHLMPFARCRPALLARSRAPGLRAAEAVEDAERRLRHERDEAAFSAR